VSAALLALAAAIALPWLYLRDVRRQKLQRAALFSQCLDLFQSYRVTQNGCDFPTLEGKYRGLPVRLEPVLDTVAWRKIPSLWLKVTLLAPNPETGVLDLLVRPQGTEFYSPSAELAHQVRVPDGWPQHSILCTDDVARMPRMQLLERHKSLFDDPHMKELLITPKGTRVVRQLWQAERAEYLVLRQARFANVRADVGLVESLLNAVIEISASLHVTAVEALDVAAVEAA
jgi:hypothetical protein